MQTRKSVVAGRFYPGSHNGCIDEINEFLDQLTLPENLPQTITAAIVPHAGWTFSGQLAAMAFAAIKQRHENPDTFVIFGAAHSYFGRQPAVYDNGSWLTPLGEIAVDQDLAEDVLNTKTAVSNPAAHDTEHSIEVQIPLLQYIFGDVKILPILTPAGTQAVELGEAIGEIITNAKQQKKIVCIGSTDLTHYGLSYGFVPMGTGPDALKWATRVNDRRFIDLAVELEPEKMLKSAEENYNACGAGAAAAAVAAAKKQNAKKGLLLAHTNSSDIMLKKMGTAGTDSVGYAAILF